MIRFEVHYADHDGRLPEDKTNCWLWITNSTIREGYEVMNAWGFEVKGARSSMRYIRLFQNPGIFLEKSVGICCDFLL